MEGFTMGPKEHLQLSEEWLETAASAPAVPDQADLLSSIAHALIATCQLKALELEMRDDVNSEAYAERDLANKRLRRLDGELWEYTCPCGWRYRSKYNDGNFDRTIEVHNKEFCTAL